MQNNNYPFNQLELAQTISTRICHDFAGPISAVNNGIELFADIASEDEIAESDMNSQIMQMLQLSAKESLAKLQMLRMAYGKASQNTNAEIVEMQDIISRFFAASKIKIQWDINCDNGKIDTEKRRILVLMTLIIAELLIFGGVIKITINNDIITIEGRNQRIKKDDDYQAILNNNNTQYPELTNKNVTLYYLRTIIDALKKEIGYCENDEDISLVVR